MIRRVAVAGSPAQIGRQTAAAIGPAVRRMVAGLPAFYRRQRMEWQALLAQAQLFLPAVQRAAPALVAEMRAFARTAGIPFDVAFFLFVEEEVMEMLLPAREKCSTAAVADPAFGTLLAHNEDYAQWFGTTLVLRTVDDGACAYAQFQYLAGFPGCTVFVNARGLSWGEDTIAIGVRPGLTKNALLWLTRHAATPAEVVRILRRHRAASGFALTVATPTERALVEVTFSGVRVRTRRGPVCHTNHALLSGPQRRTQSSLRRLAALRQAVTGNSFEKMLAAMAAPRGRIRRRFRGGAAAEATIATVVAHPAGRSLAAIGWSDPHPRFQVVRLNGGH